MSTQAGQIADADDFRPPIAVLRRTDAQPVANNTDVSVSWQQVDEDSHSGYSGGAPTRWTCPTGWDGWYEIAAHVMWEPSSTGRRMAWLWLNGSSVLATRELIWPGTSETALTVARAPLLELAAGDFVEVRAAQTSGGELDIQGGTGQASSALHVAFRRPL